MEGSLRALFGEGRKVVISVGEPWNFRSAAGDNILVGEVVGVSDADDPEWILCQVSPFMDADAAVSSVALVSRYAERIGQQLSKEGRAVVHILYEPDGSELHPSRLRQALGTNEGLKFLIGSLQLREEQPGGGNIYRTGQP